MKQVLSVVAIIDSLAPAIWIKQLIDKLERREGIQLSLLPLENSLEPIAKQHTHDCRSDHLYRYILYRQIDKPRFQQDPKACQALDKNPSTRLLTLASMAETHCDVILNLSASPLTKDFFLNESTPIWDAHLETLDARLEDALLHQEPLTWVHLWAHTRGDESNKTSEQTTRVASHALPRQTYSLSDLRCAAWSNLPSLFDSRLNWLSQGVSPTEQEHSEAFDESHASPNPEWLAAVSQAEWLSTHQFLPVALSNSAKLSRVLKLWLQQSYDRIQHRLWYEQWQLAILPPSLTPQTQISFSSDVVAKGPSFQQLRSQALTNYIAVKQPDRTWWADPHLLQHNDQLYVFFEEMGIDDTYAHISAARVLDSGDLVDVCTVLDNGEHLSYPFVFSANDEIYLIPESGSRQAIQLYRADEFPHRWALVKNLLSDVNLADTSLHHDGERWWMFTSAMSHRNVDERDELHLYFADELTGRWQAHPMNPVVTGVDRARMAGGVFQDGDTLYRPSQYGARRYGYGVNLHRIDVLNTTHYQETTHGRILPEQGSQWLGCHSISHAHGTTIVDRITRRRR